MAGGAEVNYNFQLWIELSAYHSTVWSPWNWLMSTSSSSSVIFRTIKAAANTTLMIFLTTGMRSGILPHKRGFKKALETQLFSRDQRNKLVVYHTNLPRHRLILMPLGITLAYHWMNTYWDGKIWRRPSRISWICQLRGWRRCLTWRLNGKIVWTLWKGRL